MNNNKKIKDLKSLINEGNKILKTKVEKPYAFNIMVLSVDEKRYKKWHTKLDVFILNNKEYKEILEYKLFNLSTADILETQLNKLEAIKESLENNLTNDDYNLTDSIKIKVRTEIYDHIKTYLEVEDYFHAIEEAYKVVREKLREITSEEKATNAFKEDNFEKIFGHKAILPTERDFFDGVKYLHMSIQMFRNEKSHNLAETLDKNRAYHYIILASLAYDLICKS